MTIWDLAVVCCLVLPYATAIGAARLAGASFVGYLASISIGFSVTVASVLLLRRLFNAIARISESTAKPHQGLVLLIGLIAEFACVLSAGLAAWLLTLLILRPAH